MARIKAKLGSIELEYDPISETVETEYDGIGKWVFKIVRLQPQTRTQLVLPLQEDQPIVSKPYIQKQFEGVLPSKDNILEYIIKKPDYEHDTVELQEKFLQRRVKSREEKELYFAFDRIVRDVKKEIEEKYNGKWEIAMTKTYGGRGHVYVYRFIPYTTAKGVQNPNQFKNTVVI